MKKLAVCVVSVMTLATLGLTATAQRGGAVRGGVRGAAVGELVGGESAAKAGAVIGATRGAVNRTAMIAETAGRAQYQTTPEYQSAPHSNFNDAPPEVIVDSKSSGPAAAPSGEAIIRKDGKAVLAVTFPDDWKQKTGANYVAAVSKDGQAWAVIGAVDGVKDKQAGMEKVKQGLEKSLTAIKFDDPIKTAKGTLVITGTGKGKKSGVDVVFAAGVLDAGPGQIGGAAFVVDAKVDDHYKETVKFICQTIKLAKDLAK